MDFTVLFWIWNLTSKLIRLHVFICLTSCSSLQADKTRFHAYKIDDWYRFMPQARHKTLDIDQAEEQFQLRNKVLNQFALKAKIQQQLKDADEDDGMLAKPSALVSQVK